MKLCLSALLVSLLPITPAFADTITQVFDSSHLTDTASWSGLGLESVTVPVSGSITSAEGVLVTPSASAGATLLRLNQGSWWNGGFANGDSLIYDGGGSLTLNFGSPVSGAGLWIQDNTVNYADTLYISAFDSMGYLLGTETMKTNTSGAPVFIGLIGSALDISRITIGSGIGVFAVDTLYLSEGRTFTSETPALPTPTAPEPASLMLAGAAILSAGLMLRLRS